MASGALFGGSTTRNQSKYLVEFRAGKMTLKDKIVTPDKRKGLVYVYQSDDSLMHLCWKDRSRNVVEDDLIIFPDDCEFKHVTQCKTGRVYLLKFKSTARKMFFWMQEPKSDKDEEYAKKIIENLNNPPTPGQSRAGAGGLGGLPAELASGLGGDSDLNSLLGNMSQQQLMQLLGGMGMGGGLGGLGGLSNLVGGRPGSAQSDSAPPSRVQSSPGPRSSQRSGGAATDMATTPLPPRPVTAAELPSQQTPRAQNTAAPAPAAASTGDNKESKDAASSDSGIQLRDLQTILSGMGGGSDKEPVDLASVITPDSMVPILANKDVQERLMPHLPQGISLPKTEDELRNTVSTPQFQQAMQSFSAALVSGQLGPLMGQFGLGEEVANAAAAGDVEAFAKAMQEAEKKKKESGE